MGRNAYPVRVFLVLSSVWVKPPPSFPPILSCFQVHTYFASLGMCRPDLTLLRKSPGRAATQRIIGRQQQPVEWSLPNWPLNSACSRAVSTSRPILQKEHKTKGVITKKGRVFLKFSLKAPQGKQQSPPDKHPPLRT